MPTRVTITSKMPVGPVDVLEQLLPQLNLPDIGVLAHVPPREALVGLPRTLAVADPDPSLGAVPPGTLLAVVHIIAHTLDDEDAHRTLERFLHTLPDGLVLLDALLVNETMWRSLLCRDSRCCPNSGRPRRLSS